MQNYSWRELKVPNWEPASFGASCVFENNLFFAGGWDPTTSLFSSDFWKSDSDFHWDKISYENSFSARNGHSLTVFEDKFYIIGGFNFKFRFLEDVWVLDPKKWEEGWKLVFSIGPWKYREGHQTLVFKDLLWIFGGVCSAGSLNDIWVSQDARNWEVVTENAPWSGRCFHNIQVFQNKLWLIAGSHSPKIAYNDMYFSKNGKDWELYDDNLPFSPRLGSGVTVFDDKLWLIGGSNASEHNFFNDVWWFNEKEGWNKLLVESPWNPRWAFNCVQSYNGSIVMLCGGVRHPDRKYSAFPDGWILEVN